MPTLRELTEAIQRRPGVQTAVILGADGLVIETHDVTYDHADAVAARVPAVASAARQLGAAAHLGDAHTMVLELDGGYAIILTLSPHAFLLVGTTADVALGELLFDLRRHRAPIAALV